MPTSLHLGDIIEIMSGCDLRGRVVALRKDGVDVETDDGLFMTLPYNEVVPINMEDAALLGMAKARGPNKDKHKAPAKKQPPSRSPLVVDLHLDKLPGGHTVAKNQALPFQLQVVDSYMRANLRCYGRKIIFIHGLGQGVLKEAIRKVLKSTYARNCTCCEAPNYEGIALQVCIQRPS